jgi:hypothetical protein
MGAFVFGLLLGVLLTLIGLGVLIYMLVKNSRVSTAHMLHAMAVSLVGKAPVRVHHPPKPETVNGHIPMPQPKPEEQPKPPEPAAANGTPPPRRPNLLAPDGKGKGGKS